MIYKKLQKTWPIVFLVVGILGFTIFLFYSVWIRFDKFCTLLSLVKSKVAPIEMKDSCPPSSNTQEFCSMPVIATTEIPKVPQVEKLEGGFPWPKRFTLSHIVGNQGKIDFSSNFSGASLLLAPHFKCSCFLPLLDLHGYRFDDTTYAASAGTLLRYIPSTKSTIQEIVGLNVYYDYRQGSVGYYQQFSVGLEILADRWEMRANGYIPFGHKKRIELCPASTCDRVAIHNYQDVSYGFNAELGGYCVKTPSFLIYLAAGPYFISGRPCKPNTVGGEARLRPQYKDYIALDFSYSWDPVFQSIYQAEIVLFAPLYQLGKRRSVGDCARWLTLRQIYQNVERFDVMPLGRRTCRKL